MSAPAVTGRKLPNSGSTDRNGKLVTTPLENNRTKKCILAGNKPISCWIEEIAQRSLESVRGNGHGRHGVSQGGSKLDQLLPLLFLFILSALAAYGKVTLLQNLGILPTARNLG